MQNINTYKNQLMLLVFTLLISIVHSPWFEVFFDDKEIFRYTGMAIAKGQIPYIDFFDHKPPLIFFLNMIDYYGGRWTFWFIDMLFITFTTFKFYKVNVKYNVIYPIALPILFVLIIRSHFISFDFGMTRSYSTMLYLLCFISIIEQKRLQWLWLGINSALIFFVQQDQLLLVVPLCIYAYINQFISINKAVINVFNFLFGFLIIALPIVVYFIHNNAIDEFWQNAFVFNTKWYSNSNSNNFISSIKAIKNIIFSIKLETTLLLTIILSVVSIYVGNNKKSLLFVAIAGIPLSFTSEFLSGKLGSKEAACFYYILPLAASIPILLFVIFVYTKNLFFNKKIYQSIFMALLFLNLFIYLLEYTSNIKKQVGNTLDNTVEIKLLDKQILSDYSLYVFNNSNYVYAYNKYKILSPSKWLYHYFWSWYPNWDKDTAITLSIFNNLNTHNTRFIIADLTTFPKNNIKQLWVQYLHENFVQQGNSNLFIRK